MGLTLSISLEDYLEIIYELIKLNGIANALDISQSLNVKKPSVTSALKKLAKKGLIHYQPYKPIELTKLGYDIAEKISTKHRVIKMFLVNVLEVEITQADSLACHLEHYINEEVLQKMSAFEEFVKRCPEFKYTWKKDEGFFCDTNSEKKCTKCEKEEVIEKENKMSLNLSALKPGESGIIKHISSDSKIRRKLAEMGVSKGHEIELVRIAPMGDPIEVKIRGYQLSLRKSEAVNIKVIKS
jgi:DtxR family transcriptional regulator, Mn-dependent transcriptional regulator